MSIPKPCDILTLPNPSSALTDVTVLIRTTNLSSQWAAVVDTTDGARGRAFKSDGTELATDWIAVDAANQDWIVAVLWSGTLASTGTQRVAIVPPLSTRSAYAAGDTYGRHAAYASDVEGYWPLGGGEDRTGKNLDLTANGGVTVGGASGPLGPATSYGGIDDVCSAPAPAALQSAPLTLECLYNRTGSPGHLVNLSDSSVTNQQLTIISNDFPDRFTATSFSGSTSPAEINTADGVWRYGAGSFDGTNHFAYLDNTQSSVVASGTAPTGIDTIGLGLSVDATPVGIVGLVQHAAVYSTAKGVDFLAYRSDMLRDNATFVGTTTHVPGSILPVGGIDAALGGLGISGFAATSIGA